MRRREQGFTLVEVLVALFVFGLVAAGCVYSLRLAINTRDELGATDKRMAEFETARAIIRDDMLQLADRKVRDEFGSFAGPAFLGGQELELTRRAPEGEKLLLAFVRRGWVNPEARAPRSTLQYIEYILKDGAFIRRTRPYLDDARGEPRVERILFRNVQSADISFLAGEAGGALDWTPGWPERGAQVFPRAISVVTNTPRYGRIEQRFWIGVLGGAPQGNPS
ncbi:MAG TPA: type II secretion system minor pseudopilin GspJ [Parvularculaceae bacterium]|nr:type II secretion system minor pseudopilin GspJ [Parvularculaceae bacterium]